MAVMPHGVKLARRTAEQPTLKEWITRELRLSPGAVADVADRMLINA